MSSPSPTDVRSDVYALLGDLLPVLAPGSTLDADRDEVLIPWAADRARVSTASLLEACAERESTGWPRFIESWLNDIDRQRAEASAGIESVEQLRIQALPRSMATEGLTADFNSAFALRVMADQTGSTRFVQRADLDRFGLSPEDAVRTALDQTIGHVLVRLQVQTQTMPGGSHVQVASADGVPYVSAGVTSIQQLAGTDLPYGALVAVPRHSMLLIQPVLARRDLSTVAILEGFAYSMFDGASDRCTQQLFWFVDGDAHPLGTERGPDGKPALVLTPQLAPVADRLPG